MVARLVTRKVAWTCRRHRPHRLLRRLLLLRARSTARHQTATSPWVVTAAAEHPVSRARQAAATLR